jgi:hypothetical protein
MLKFANNVQFVLIFVYFYTPQIQIVIRFTIYNSNLQKNDILVIYYINN